MSAATPVVSSPAYVPSSRPYLTMGLTFLLLGIGFANPFPLVLSFPSGIWEGNISREALNLYALTVFLGWGHFFYAWQGQWRGSKRFTPSHSAAYWSSVALLMVVLVVRGLLGVAIFSLIPCTGAGKSRKGLGCQ